METVTLNQKEQKRAFVLNQVNSGQQTAEAAAEVLGISVRQLRRILAAYRQEGVASLIHGNFGRAPAHMTELEVKDRVVELAEGRYKGLNHCHLTEKLVEVEGLKLSRSTVRRILLESGIKSPKKRRPPKHRSRRPRKTQSGMMLQLDASPHDWLEGRGPKLTLVAAIDDATGEVPAARFRVSEDAHGYLLVMQDVALTLGRPLAVYHDRHSIFRKLPNEKLSVQEQLAGKAAPTQFGRMLEELQIESIAAYSPQAKGRVERFFGAGQDRLVSELRLAGAATMEEANEVLKRFLPEYNRRFAVAATEVGSAYRPLPEGIKPEEVFCFKYERTVGMDNTVRLGEHRLQILPGPKRRSYAKARVQIHERLDGSLVVYHQGQQIATQAAPPEAPQLRARSGGLDTLQPNPSKAPSPDIESATAVIDSSDQLPKPPYKPGPKHPWRGRFLVGSDKITEQLT